MANILAIDTYGSQRVKCPQTGRPISAYKMGYSSAASSVLLALYGDKARNVSSKQASYHYIQLDGAVTVRHGYILHKVSDTLLREAEQITRRFHRAAVFLWLDGTWCELPTQQQADYCEALPRSGPDFNPGSLLLVDASSGEKAPAVSGISVEKSQCDPNEKAWFWITGDTYPHREHLKAYGCRWSQKRKAWYYIGWALHSAIEQLVETHRIPENGEAPVNEANHRDEPCTVEEAANILSVRVRPDAATSDETPRLYALGDVVCARHDLESPDGRLIPTGTCGTVTRLYNRNLRHGWSYDVDFEDYGDGRYFERELTAEEPISGTRMPLESLALPAGELPSDADIKRGLIEAGQEPAPLVVEDEKTITTVTAQPEKESSIRIWKPELSLSSPDPVLTAIQHVRSNPPASLSLAKRTSNNRVLVTIPQQPVGELTGSISGNVWCYGYAVHDGIAIYINLGGPRMAVEAIRAKLAKGDVVNCVPWDAPAVELTAGEGNTGMYTAFVQNISEAKFTSLILVHDQLIHPNYGGKATTFVFHASDEQAQLQLHQHVTELVKVAVFDEWVDYLWQAGQAAMLVRPVRSAGGLPVLAIDLDTDSWSRLLTGGLQQGLIALPQMT